MQFLLSHSYVHKFKKHTFKNSVSDGGPTQSLHTLNVRYLGGKNFNIHSDLGH